MQRFTLSLLAIALSTALFVPTAKADSSRETLASQTTATTTPSTRSAFEVVTLAYQGQLSEQGIPSYDALVAGVQSGRYTADAIVNAAIAAGQLTPDTVDQGFLSAVDRYLDHLSNPY